MFSHRGFRSLDKISLLLPNTAELMTDSPLNVTRARSVIPFVLAEMRCCSSINKMPVLTFGLERVDQKMITYFVTLGIKRGFANDVNDL